MLAQEKASLGVALENFFLKTFPHKFHFQIYKTKKYVCSLQILSYLILFIFVLFM